MGFNHESREEMFMIQLSHYINNQYELNVFFFLRLRVHNFIILEPLSLNLLFHLLLQTWGSCMKLLSQPKAYPQFFLFFFFFMDEPLAYRNSWASKSNWSHSHGLCHSHSNAVSELHLRPRPQIAAIPDPQATQ